MAERYRERVQSDPIGARTPGPGGALWRITAEALGGVARTAGDWADRAAAKAGAREGTQAGMTPEGLALRRDGTIRGEAYDVAAIRTASVQLDSKVREEMATLYDAAGHDAVKFADGVDAIQKKYIDTIPVETRPDFSAALQRQRFPYDREIARKRQQLTQSQDAAALQSMLAGREAEFGRMAFQSGLDPDADAVLSAEAQSVAKELLKFGPKEEFEFAGATFPADDTRAGLLSPDMIHSTLQQLSDTGDINRVKGAFERTAGLNSQMEFLKEFRADYAQGEGVAKGMTLKTTEALDSWMEARIRDGIAEARAGASELRAEISDIRSNLADYRSFARDGLMPEPGVVAGLQARAMATGDRAIMQEVAGLDRLIGIGQAVVRTDPLQLADAIHTRREIASAAGASPQDAAELGLMETALSQMNTALQKDPLTYAARAGVIDLDPLPLGIDPVTEEMVVQPGALSRRRQQALAVAARYGSPLKLFTEEEAAAAQTVERMGGHNLVTLAAQIVGELKSNAGPALAQLNDKGAPMLAHLGGLMLNGSSPDVTDAAARGIALLADAKGVASGFNTGTSGAQAKAALGGLDLPEVRASIEQAANAIYVGRRGLNAAFDEKAYAEALQEAAGASFRNKVQFGGLVRVGKQTVIAPPWLRASALPDLLHSLDPLDWSLGGGGASPVDTEGRRLPLSTLKGATFVPVAPGRFQLELQQGGEPVGVLDADGNDYELDLDRLRGRNAIDWQEWMQ